MTSDLPGGLHPEELGSAEPGLEQLLRTLTSDGTPRELAGEPAAMAMFRADVRARASEAPTLVSPVLEPAGPPPPRRPRVRRGFPRLRVAVITATALVGGFAAAAYAAVLPAPVQHVAYQALHVLGVPDVRHSHGAGAAGGSPGGGPAGQSPGRPQPGHSGASGNQAGPSSHPSGPSSQPPAAGGAPSGPAVLSAQAVNADIPAGTSATINGMLTLGGSPGGGVYIRLVAHAAGRAGWLQVGRTQNSAQGDVSFTTPVLRRNTEFVLAGAGRTRSTVVAITVLPQVSAKLIAGPKGVKDYVVVGTSYASSGDVVLLQVLQGGTWVTVKQGVLNAAGRVTIAVSATQRQGEELQAVLLATSLHGEAASPPVTVPSPG